MMLQTLEDVLFAVSAWIILLPVSIVLLRFRLLDKASRIIAWLVCWSCFIEVLSYVMGHYLRMNNIPLLHLYTPVEFCLITIFYARVLPVVFRGKRLWWITGSFIVFSAVNSFYLQNLYAFNTYSRGLEAAFFICLSLICFGRMIRELNNDRPQHDPVFWINAGFLLYFSGALFLFILSNYILPMKRQTSLHIWAFHSFLSILLYTMISIGLWKAKKISMYSSPSLPEH
jgi:hypothetical protein